jgi:streptogramin lyase
VHAAGSAAARAGGSAAQRAPLQFVWPTSIDLQPDGSLLVVENGAGRVDRVRPATGQVTIVAAGLAKPFAAVRTASGLLYVSNGHALLRNGKTVARADEDIGPVAVAANGDVFYTTQTAAFRLGDPKPLATGLDAPHGIAVATDGAVLVSDTRHDRVLRIAGGDVSTLIAVRRPGGIDVAPDGTIDLVEAAAKRVARYSAAGKRLGNVGPRYFDPYDVQVARNGVVYVLDTAALGTIKRVGPNGDVSVVRGL